MSVYDPPAGDEVDFPLDAYDPVPAGDEVDFPFSIEVAHVVTLTEKLGLVDGVSARAPLTPRHLAAPGRYLEATHWERVEHKFNEKTPGAMMRGVIGAAAQEHWHERILKATETLGVTPIDQFNYMAYADELKYKLGAMEWRVDRHREHQIMRTKWENRGLTPAVLDAIDSLFPWQVGKTFGG